MPKLLGFIIAWLVFMACARDLVWGVIIPVRMRVKGEAIDATAVTLHFVGNAVVLSLLVWFFWFSGSVW